MAQTTVLIGWIYDCVFQNLKKKHFYYFSRWRKIIHRPWNNRTQQFHHNLRFLIFSCRDKGFVVFLRSRCIFYMKEFGKKICQSTWTFLTFLLDIMFFPLFFISNEHSKHCLLESWTQETGSTGDPLSWPGSSFFSPQ